MPGGERDTQGSAESQGLRARATSKGGNAACRKHKDGQKAMHSVYGDIPQFFVLDVKSQNCAILLMYVSRKEVLQRKEYRKWNNASDFVTTKTPQT